MTYYFTETTHLNVYTKAEALKATNLTAAKREASRKQVFENTILSISYAIDDNDFIREVAYYKKNGKWIDCSDF